MALVNEILVGRFNSILNKLLGMKEGAPSPQVSSDIVPTIPLEVDRPEWRYLANERLCWAGVVRAAVAAQNSSILLYNPSGSNVIAVVTNVQPALNAGQTVYAGHYDLNPVVAGWSQAGSGLRDSRFSRTTQITTCQTYTLAQVGVAVTTILWRYNMYGQPCPPIPFPIILTPGTGLAVAASAVNNTLDCSFAWTERALEPSELR